MASTHDKNEPVDAQRRIKMAITTEKELELAKELTQTRDLLSKAMDTLDAERKAVMSAKNKVSGGYYMMSRRAEKNLRTLQRENASASLVFSVIREHMQIGTNAVTISNEALAKILGISTRTVARATKHLKDKNYVQVVKIGSSNTYVVNEQVAFAGNVGQRKAVFSATVVAHECDQQEDWNTVKKLKAVPVIYEDERVILGVDELPPPDQQDLDLD